MEVEIASHALQTTLFGKIYALALPAYIPSAQATMVWSAPPALMDTISATESVLLEIQFVQPIMSTRVSA